MIITKDMKSFEEEAEEELKFYENLKKKHNLEAFL